MSRLQLAIAALLAASSGGCAATREGIFDGVFDCVWDSTWSAVFGDSDAVDEDEARVLQRKGIESGSTRHNRLRFEESHWEETH